MLDTNILISAVVFDGICRKIVDKLLQQDKIFISFYIDHEFRDKVIEKWPKQSKEILKYYENLAIPILEDSPVIIVHTRDGDDDQVISDAIYNHMDILFTGDKDFDKDLDTKGIKIMTISEMKNILICSDI